MQRNDLITKIKCLESRLSIDQSLHEEMLFDRFRVTSCTELDFNKLYEFFKELEEKGIEAGVWINQKSITNRWKYNELGDRPEMASPKQLRMLNSMWNTSLAVRAKTDAAFNEFVSRIAEVESYKWLKKEDVQKVKKAIENLAKKKRKA